MKTKLIIMAILLTSGLNMSAQKKNKNKTEITVINDTHLHNFKTYIARIQENQNHLLLNIEKNKGNTIVANDKMDRLEEKIKQLEIDFKNLLIKRSN